MDPVQVTSQLAQVSDRFGLGTILALLFAILSISLVFWLARSFFLLVGNHLRTLELVIERQAVATEELSRQIGRLPCTLEKRE